MIDTATLIAYVTIVPGFVFIPGPATLLTVARATSSGTKAGIATGAGIAAGDVVHTVMAIIGVSAIIATSAVLFSVIKYAGAAYLIYLGLVAIFDKTPPDLKRGSKPISAGKAFNQAIIAEVLNPKTALFFLAFLPQFVDVSLGTTQLQFIVLGLIVTCTALPCDLLVAWTADKAVRFFAGNPWFSRLQNTIAGTILVSLGVYVAATERPG